MRIMSELIRYTPEERSDLLKKSMGEENYNRAVTELMPFGGGMSEYYDIYKIPPHKPLVERSIKKNRIFYGRRKKEK